MSTRLVESEEYVSFRSSVPQKKIIVDDDDEKVWTIYDAGPRDVRCPLICLPPASGRADIFFKQMLSLTSRGYRVISVDYPVYWDLKEWAEGFRKLIDQLQLDKVHIFGASLGGFLGQKFAEYTHMSPRVHSLILCNSFVETSIFQQTSSAHTFWMMPAVLLKKMVMGNFEKGYVDNDIADSIDFMVESVDSFGQQELASRLTLNCVNSYVQPQKLRYVDLTIIDVFDPCALSNTVKEEVYKCYPEARRAHMKDGGNFPYLSRAEEVNLYLQIHLKAYLDTRYSAMEPREEILSLVREASRSSTTSSPSASGPSTSGVSSKPSKPSPPSAKPSVPASKPSPPNSSNSKPSPAEKPSPPPFKPTPPLEKPSFPSSKPSPPPSKSSPPPTSESKPSLPEKPTPPASKPSPPSSKPSLPDASNSKPSLAEKPSPTTPKPSLPPKPKPEQSGGDNEAALDNNGQIPAQQDTEHVTQELEVS